MRITIAVRINCVLGTECSHTLMVWKRATKMALFGAVAECVNHASRSVLIHAKTTSARVGLGEQQSDALYPVPLFKTGSQTTGETGKKGTHNENCAKETVPSAAILSLSMPALEKLRQPTRQFREMDPVSCAILYWLNMRKASKKRKKNTKSPHRKKTTERNRQILKDCFAGAYFFPTCGTEI